MPRRARSRRSWRARLSRCRRAWWLRAAAGSSPPSAPGGQSWPAGPVGGRGSHATAPLPAAPPCGMRSHQRAPPGEETHNLNPGPHEQGAPAQPPSFKVLHHLTAPNTTKLPRTGSQPGPTQAPLASLSHAHREAPGPSAAWGARPSKHPVLPHPRTPRSRRPALGGRRCLRAEATSGRPQGTEALSRPHGSAPCGTMNAQHCLALDHVLKHSACEHLFPDVPPLWVCHPQNESPEPSPGTLKSGWTLSSEQSCRNLPRILSRSSWSLS